MRGSAPLDVPKSKTFEGEELLFTVTPEVFLEKNNLYIVRIKTGGFAPS